MKRQIENLKIEKEKNPDIRSSFWSNIKRTILFPRDKGSMGPSAYIGEIVLHKEVIRELSRYKSESEQPFKYLIAHELVHAFNKMIFIVPAFLDWNEFWEKALNHGSNCQNARQVLARLEAGIDCYGTNKELKELKKYWPSNAEKWFNAWQDLKKKT
jgi:hypothetical protein